MATMTPNPSGLYITEVTLPSNNTYEIVDKAARETLTNLSSYSKFLGVVSNTNTPISDGSTNANILIGTTSTTVTAEKGNIVIYKPSTSTTAQEFIFDGEKWQFFGDISADNLGELAFKDSATGSHIHITSVNSGSGTVTSSGSYTATGTITLNKVPTTVTITSTTTDPGAGNTANYWIYTPQGTVTASAGISGGSTTKAIVSFTQDNVVKSIATSAPSSTTTGMIDYAKVNEHTLQLHQIKPSAGNAITDSVSADIVKTVGTISASATFNGSKEFIPPLSLNLADTATFTGIAKAVSVTSSAKFINSITVTTANVSITVS